MDSHPASAKSRKEEGDEENTTSSERPRLNDFVYLPRDIIANIFSRVPVKSVLRFKCVSKSWYNLFTHDTYFIDTHLRRAIENRCHNFIIPCSNYFYSAGNFSHPSIPSSSASASAVKLNYPFKLDHENPYSVTVHTGSCHGLFLVGDQDFTVLYLWNPMTQEYNKLPDTLSPSGVNRQDMTDGCGLTGKFKSVYGLGYDSNNNHYKVVGMYYYKNTDNHKRLGDICVYSLKTNSINKIQDIPHFVPNAIVDNSYGVFVSGAIHWVLPVTFEMVSFVVSSEEFKQVPMPVFITKDMRYIKLSHGELKGCLCLFLHDPQDNIMDVVTMKEYGVKESWTKLFTISLCDRSCYFLKPLFFSDDKEVVIHGKLWSGTSIALYDPEKRNAVFVDILDVRERFFHIETYVGSFVSPKQIVHTENH